MASIFMRWRTRTCFWNTGQFASVKVPWTNLWEIKQVSCWLHQMISRGVPPLHRQKEKSWGTELSWHDAGSEAGLPGLQKNKKQKKQPKCYSKLAQSIFFCRSALLKSCSGWVKKTSVILQILSIINLHATIQIFFSKDTSNWSKVTAILDNFWRIMCEGSLPAENSALL